jgi:hypothetical protein
LVLKVLFILLLLWVKQKDLRFALHRVLYNISIDLKVLKKHQCVKGTQLYGFNGVFCTENNHTSVLRDLLEEFADQSPLLDKIYIRESLRAKRYSFVEAVLSTVRNVQDRKDAWL